ncbi:hypothetical protein BESB_078010 [Besnoitia besnoiti]|uniref:Uncharacterized protein n=1 Tax=Besnoitia besnoiti TaxID=94643 RepID=A0A2A9M8T0_BESBE|nr:hypothetical protein BESB_078010 [Besnoitia besnoiti]PFH33584.1 hypothetical protein BESB_078010 [Besnoitia besnoiti]
MARSSSLRVAAFFFMAALAYPGCAAPVAERSQKPADAKKADGTESADLTDDGSFSIVTNEGPLPYPVEKMQGPPLSQCDSDHVGAGFTAVAFEGNLVWTAAKYPAALSNSTVLTIEVQDATKEDTADRPILFVYRNDTRSDYKAGEPISFAFCAKIPENKNITQYGLHTRLNIGAVHVQGGTQRPESYIGLTEVESGINEYSKLRVRMFPIVTVEQTTEDSASTEESPGATGKARVSKYEAACNFASVDEEGFIGVATEVAVGLPSALDPTQLPKPTYLTVRMDDITTDEDEPQAVALFSSDITQWYEKGAPLTALLCAKLPDHGESIMYRVVSILKLGGEERTQGAKEATSASNHEKTAEESSEETSEEDDLLTTLRQGDFVGTTMVVVLPDKVDYTATVNLEAYKPEA